MCIRDRQAQYSIAAEIIYSALVAEELEWIAIADPDAGRLDDIQVATPGRIDAYQVKWGEQVGTCLLYTSTLWSF